MHAVTRSKPRAWARRLVGQSRGVSAVEFALGLPVFLALGGYGVEVANLAIMNMRLSQYALQLADNAARIGVNSGLAIYTLREGDINDVLEGVQLFGARANLTKNGRITLSSLENVQRTFSDVPSVDDTAPVQRLHWQRCIGLRSDAAYASSYGPVTPQTTAGTTKKKSDAGLAQPSGVGDNVKVSAPSGSGVMFVEINYEYQPLFGNVFVGKKRLHYTASAIVRDSRDFAWIDNPSPAVNRLTCNLYTASAV